MILEPWHAVRRVCVAVHIQPSSATVDSPSAVHSIHSVQPTDRGTHHRAAVHHAITSPNFAAKYQLIGYGDFGFYPFRIGRIFCCNCPRASLRFALGYHLLPPWGIGIRRDAKNTAERVEPRFRLAVSRRRTRPLPTTATKARVVVGHSATTSSTKRTTSTKRATATAEGASPSKRSARS